MSYSAYFNGTSSKIDCGVDFIGTKAFSFCGWMNIKSFGEGISSNSGFVIVNNQLHLFLASSSSRFGLTSNNFTSNAYAANNSIVLNQWLFVSLTRTAAGVVNFYLGDLTNAPAVSGTANQASGTPTAGSVNIYIGNNSSGTRSFDGLIPMISIHEATLTLNQITQIWSSTKNSIGN